MGFGSLEMDGAAAEAPVGPVVVQLHPRPVLVEAGALPLDGAGVIALARHARGADEGRQDVGGAPQREPAEQRPGHRPGQEREEVAGEDRDAERALREEAARGGDEEGGEEEEGEGEEPQPGASHGGEG